MLVNRTAWCESSYGTSLLVFTTDGSEALEDAVIVSHPTGDSTKRIDLRRVQITAESPCVITIGSKLGTDDTVPLLTWIVSEVACCPIDWEGTRKCAAGADLVVTTDKAVGLAINLDYTTRQVVN